MKFVAIIVLTLVILQVAFATDEKKRAEEFESSLSNYLQSAAQSAAAQSAAALSVAASESAAAATNAQSSFPASKLESSSAGRGESSGCRSFSCGNGNAEGPSVKDAVQPIEDWIKDFKARTGGSNSGDMMKAAKMVIHPLIVKLKRSQHEALEKLEESDAEIVRSVEEKATEHVYNLLRAENISQKKEDASEQRKQKLADVKAEAAEKEKEAKMVAENSAEHSAKKK